MVWMNAQQVLEDRVAANADRALRQLLLHQIFEAQAEAQPGAVAVVFGDEAVTYGELEARANRFARYLRRRGVKPGTSVAMMLPRSIHCYSTMLGILKAGAAYVPVDPEYPADRIAWMLEDSGAGAIATAADLVRSHLAFPGAVIQVDADQEEIAAESAEPLEENSANPDDLCYIIYTSGSTGRPKGVMVEHRNASHLVRAEGRLFEVHPDDRVYQGASLSFDLSVEEIWLAFHAGAVLVAATPEMAQAGPDLPRQLTEYRVTVLSCVPTLLSMFTEDVPSVRLLILGGETCPSHLIARWARPGRRLVNTYGPTETTVIATYADVSPEKPVTIGRPVPGYEVYILDDELRPVPQGGEGEICIGGAGVARGYRGLPGESGLRFVRDPFVFGGGGGARMYRSGDFGHIDGAGNIRFAGRLDNQVKLRGLRIELDEIESTLLRADNIQAVACAVRENARGDLQLIGYVVPRDAKAWHEKDEERVASQLRSWLPAWMVPSLIETVADLPRLPSGKLDRASLPAPRIRKTRRSHGRPGESPAAQRLLELWNVLFQPLEVSPDDDFFLDLGGHSLLAAQMVSELRKDQRFASITVRDVYKNPTISRLASAIDSSAQPIDSPLTVTPESCDGTADDAATLRHFVAGVVQAASLYVIFGFRGAQWITPYLVYFVLAAHRPVLESVAWAVASGISLFPALIVIAICAKWSLLGRIRPGQYPLWGGFYLRWWFVQTLIGSIPLTRLGGTPLLPFVYRLFGASMGKDVHIGTDLLAAFDVISVGDGASIDEGASLLGYTVEDDALIIGPVSIGHSCFVGTRSVLSPNTVMEEGARLEDLSLLQSGARIPAGQTWAGSPPECVARPAKPDLPREPHTKRSPAHRVGLVALYVLLAFCLPLVEVAAFVPGVALLTHFNPASPLFYLTAPVVGASFIICLTTLIVLLKWLLIGRARAGTYPVHGWFYVRNWVVEQLLALSVDIAGPLHATVFLKPWYRALGARLGRFAEVSTASVTTPDLLDIGEDCTIADEVSLGAARIEGGWLTLASTRLGRRSFVGNSAVIPAGTELSDRSLVGVLTIAPSTEARSGCSSEYGTSWLGSPAIFLPHRQQSDAFPEGRTFRPGRRLQWIRGCFEIFRVTLPGAGLIIVTVAVIETAVKLWGRLGPGATFLLLPALFAASSAVVLLAVVLAKWIIMGRYQPFTQPFWSTYVWRLEFVNALFEFLATPMGLEALQGTPFIPWYLRLLGARIGRRVYIDSTGFLEFDLTEIGDRSILNRDCILQTHLFEDRVLKASGLHIGAGCQIGTQSIVLYDAEMKDNARLGPLSLLMKGEVLPAGKTWTGSPLGTAEPRRLARSHVPPCKKG